MRIDAIILRELHLPLVRPFETSFDVTRNRRILLAEVQSEGLTGRGECTAGERPFFSAESTESAWQVIVNELGPMLAASEPEHGGECPRIFRQVRGNPMAKATLENAIWDLEAQREGLPLAQLFSPLMMPPFARPALENVVPLVVQATRSTVRSSLFLFSLEMSADLPSPVSASVAAGRVVAPGAAM